MPQALGLGVMLVVWNTCQERETYELSDVALDAIGLQCGYPGTGFCKAVEQADLARRVRRGVYYIVGTKGRIEWLARARQFGEKGREHGIKGGRPKNDNPRGGIGGKPPPTPAPALGAFGPHRAEQSESPKVARARADGPRATLADDKDRKRKRELDADHARDVTQPEPHGPRYHPNRDDAVDDPPDDPPEDRRPARRQPRASQPDSPPLEGPPWPPEAELAYTEGLERLRAIADLPHLEPTNGDGHETLDELRARIQRIMGA